MLLCFFNFASPASASASDVHLLINIPAHWVRLYRGNKAIVCFPVAVGKYTSQTPVGNFSVIDKEINPTWIDPEDPSVRIASGKGNPLGYRWIGIGGNYGIHGTNHPDSVGKYASGGCIRMHEANIEEIFRHVKLGTPVKIIYNRLVVETTPTGVVDYYVYPDGYHRQPLSVASISNALQKYGVADFLDVQQAQKALEEQTGDINYVAYPIRLRLADKVLPFKAVKYDTDIYLPAVALAKSINLPVEFDAAQKIIKSRFGTAHYIEKNGHAYINLLDVLNVYDLENEWNTKAEIVLTPLSNPAETLSPAPVPEEIPPENSLKG